MFKHKLFFPLLVAAFSFIVFSQIALLDRTESRVAVIANHLVEQNNIFHLLMPKDGQWVTYWAKPPLQYWLIALSIDLFGKNEFSVRLPSLIAGFLTLLILPCFRTEAKNASAIAGSTLLFFGVYGTGLIDGPLTLTLTITLLGLYRWIVQDNRSLSTILFISLGMGLACAFKGLLGLAIPGITVGAYAVLHRNSTTLLTLPWLRAGAIFFIIVIFYYGVIEYYNPGFCKYFFVNENVLRFLTKDYGDRTGSGHAQIYGSSIVFFLFSFLPWTPLLLKSLYQRSVTTKEELFFLAATLAPVTLFLFAKQHLATYQLPAIIPASLLLSERISRRTIVTTAGVMFMLYLTTGIVISKHLNSFFSSAPIIEAASARHADQLLFQYEIPLSAYWYSPAYNALATTNPNEADTTLNNYFIVRDKHQGQFQAEFGQRSVTVEHLGKWYLYTLKHP